uniref:Uncharacterized protein n=1 Tax=Myoviridae sp. ctnjE18 TaxID=2827706 RepID=A0A8S5SUY2_9CAUD|nr:MAG TPA: hypothetical protein [Myoviridae sp. ctnjE18]
MTSTYRQYTHQSLLRSDNRYRPRTHCEPINSRRLCRIVVHRVGLPLY